MTPRTDNRITDEKLTDMLRRARSYGNAESLAAAKEMRDAIIAERERADNAATLFVTACTAVSDYETALQSALGMSELAGFDLLIGRVRELAGTPTACGCECHTGDRDHCDDCCQGDALCESCASCEDVR